VRTADRHRASRVPLADKAGGGLKQLLILAGLDGDRVPLADKVGGGLKHQVWVTSAAGVGSPRRESGGWIETNSDQPDLPFGECSPRRQGFQTPIFPASRYPSSRRSGCSLGSPPPPACRNNAGINQAARGEFAARPGRGPRRGTAPEGEPSRLRWTEVTLPVLRPVRGGTKDTLCRA
jgi:hypothetical protein